MGKPRLTAVVIWALLAPLLLTCVVQERELFKLVALRGVSRRTPLHRMTGDRQVDCSVACARLPACLSFSFRPGPQGCSLYPRRTILLDIDFSLNATDLHFWKLLKTCPSEMGYFIIPGTKKCLRFVQTPMTWDAAAAFCAQDGGHLVTIDNADVAQAVTLRYHELGYDLYYYVGLSDKRVEGQFRWMDGSPLDGSLVSVLEVTDQNTSNDEDCVMLAASKLFDDNCLSSRPFACSLPVVA